MAKAVRCINFICDNCGKINYHQYSLEKGSYEGKVVMKDRIDCVKCSYDNFVYEEIKEGLMQFTSGDGESVEIKPGQYAIKEMVNDIAEESRVIVCAAIRHKSSNLIICGPRHFDAIMNQQIRNNAYKGWNDADQGFVDQFGKFLTRSEAHIIATKKNQIIRRVGGDKSELFSENLY